MVSGFTFCFCVLLQTAFLHVFVKNDILQPGAFDHSVLYATAQLTEGRSAGINPSSRQQKKALSFGFAFTLALAHFGSLGVRSWVGRKVSQRIPIGALPLSLPFLFLYPFPCLGQLPCPSLCRRLCPYLCPYQV